ncbi:DNA repair protein RecN [Latilactobacillus curvatus]|uniref:DNA repair protein RecN n=1 Tax=Latilactobacillus curvatus TaxID=28038 RepID=UPI000B609D56|nr:DNA repair protein RecN [Latilactobacillus curvatus]ASN62349.1 DNA repair protein RecN [Latilactobacillus curvatus]MCT2879610.1 DNA repair protein RecN [Latilactobacillus curvatus]
MLQELVIHDFAIIDQLAISFEEGMTVLSGETGAGKSIIIDAVGLLAGGRGSQDFIRTGAKKATLEGLFTMTPNGTTAAVLDQFGIEHDEQTVLLQRDLAVNGHNVCRVNGYLVNTTTLKHIGETLVDIHGQNEHQELMYPDRHLGLLDEFAHQKLTTAKAAYAETYAAYRKAQRALKQKQQNEQEWAQRLDMLKFQTNEIDAAQLQADEESKLVEERAKLMNFQKINQALQASHTILAGEDGNALDQIAVAMNQMQEIAELDPEFKRIADSLQTGYYTLQDSSIDISREVSNLEWDEARLDEIEQRLETINNLEHKYGDSIAEILAYGEKIGAELAAMQVTEANASELEQQFTQLEQQLRTNGQTLTQLRQKAAKQLEKAVHQQLKALYMEKTVFKVEFLPNEQEQFMASGMDKVEFYIQPNPGEKLRPLAKIASGGELSRLMLALKTIFSESQGVTSIIFDEVDTGVSGRVAQAIANKISEIGQHSQVLCITHLPQVAAMSDHQYQIQKQVKQNRTETSVQKVTGKQRIAELARMLAGTEVTELTLEHAEELVALAETAKQSRRH